MAEQSIEVRADASGQHLCIYRDRIHICKTTQASASKSALTGQGHRRYYPVTNARAAMRWTDRSITPTGDVRRGCDQGMAAAAA